MTSSDAGVTGLLRRSTCVALPSRRRLAAMLLSNETKSIRYETIDTLCAIFQCTPNELFVYVEDDMDNKI